MSKDIEFKGMDETLKKMDEMIKTYPDVSITAMERASKKFKKSLRENTRNALHGSTEDNYKRLVSGFRTTVKGYGKNVISEFSAESSKNHDWHLVENGHELKAPNKRHVAKMANGKFATIGVEPGKNLGFVPGIHQLDKTIDGFGSDFEKSVEKAMDELVKKYE